MARQVNGQTFRLDSDDEPGDASRVQLPHPEILKTLDAGDTLLVDDGKLRLTVSAKGEGYVDAVVDVGGAISDRKGVNTPSVVLPISPLTPKDRADLAFALTQPVDWVALSFVQRPEDIDELRSIVKNSNRKRPRRGKITGRIDAAATARMVRGVVSRPRYRTIRVVAAAERGAGRHRNYQSQAPTCA